MVVKPYIVEGRVTRLGFSFEHIIDILYVMINDKKPKKGTMNVPASRLPDEPERKKGDFRHSFHWRIFRIMAEFVDGFQFLADFKNTVTIFGSARSSEDDEWYKEARKLGQLLVQGGYGVITGGGPGIMEAGNRGACDIGKCENGDTNSIGLNIKLPYGQRINPYVTKSIGFHYFFVRKVMLSFAAQAYVYFPGGLGTLDELFELSTLIQTKKISQEIPVILVGKEFWGPLYKWMQQDVYEKLNAIDKEDLDIFKLVDSAQEAFDVIKSCPKREEF